MNKKSKSDTNIIIDEDKNKNKNKNIRHNMNSIMNNHQSIQIKEYYSEKETVNSVIDKYVYMLNDILNNYEKKELMNDLNIQLQNNSNDTKIVITKNELKQDMLIIIRHALKLKYNEIFSSYCNRELRNFELKKIIELLNRYYLKREPLQYIIGLWPFYNEEYIVTKDVLVPRPDTELLVEQAIEYINKYSLKSCIDMCSGSGAIGISIAKNSCIDKVIMVDISKEAIDIANKNIAHNDLESKLNNELSSRTNANFKKSLNEKCITVVSDLFYGLTLKKNLRENLNTKANTKKDASKEEKNHNTIYIDKVDIIVSNPPYIPTKDIELLTKYVKNEPYIALDGGITGMDIYDRILNNANSFLNKNGYIMFEIGYDEKEKMITLINEKYSKYYEYISCIKDYNNQDRVIICKKNNL